MSFCPKCGGETKSSTQCLHCGPYPRKRKRSLTVEHEKTGNADTALPASEGQAQPDADRA